jgi:hypothetical protein
MVRATASSPSDMSHLRTLSIEAENPTINESDENTRTLIQQQTVDSIQYATSETRSTSETKI